MVKQQVSAADKSIGRRIQQRRKELGITAAALSERLGISQQQLSRYERGSNKINVAHLVNIAVLVDVPIGWFFLDCKTDSQGMVNQPQKGYVAASEVELKKRLDQQWQSFSLEQQQALVAFLDSLKLPFNSGS